jgi:DNA-binding winged helix-turn-helix (wHTH) protein
LLRRGQPIALRRKLYDLLKVLVERRGQVVEKDDLINLVWPGLIVEDSNLTVSINALRRFLGGAEYIETVNRRGYRFAMEVRVVQAPLLHYREEPEPPGGAMPLDSRFYIAHPGVGCLDRTIPETTRSFRRHPTRGILRRRPTTGHRRNGRDR